MKNLILVAIGILFVIGCCKDDDHTSDCDYAVKIQEDGMAVPDTNYFSIQTVNLSGDCLEVTYSSSGCDGSSWKVDLYDSGVIKESNPVQRYLIFSLVNEELCDAYITKTTSFDVSELKEDYDSVILNLGQYPEPILYE